MRLLNMNSQRFSLSIQGWVLQIEDTPLYREKTWPRSGKENFANHCDFSPTLCFPFHDSSTFLGSFSTSYCSSPSFSFSTTMRLPQWDPIMKFFLRPHSPSWDYHSPPWHHNSTIHHNEIVTMRLPSRESQWDPIMKFCFDHTHQHKTATHHFDTITLALTTTRSSSWDYHRENVTTRSSFYSWP